MTTFIENLSLGEINTIIGIFFICGLVVYFVDFKILQREESNYRRETAFSKFIACTFIYGSFVIFVLLKILDWML